MAGSRALASAYESSSGPYASMRSIITSRTLTTWLTAPSGTASSARRALATEVAADMARSRDVAISSTSRARIEPPAGSVACASRTSTNLRPIARPSPTAPRRSAAAVTTRSAPTTDGAVGGSTRPSATSGSLARRLSRRSRRSRAERRSASSASIVPPSISIPVSLTRSTIVSRSARSARASSTAGRYRKTASTAPAARRTSTTAAATSMARRPRRAGRRWASGAGSPVTSPGRR